MDKVHHDKVAPPTEDESASGADNFSNTDNTNTDSISQELVAFRLKIEQDRRDLAKELSVVYGIDPAAAVSYRYVLRDLRLLGVEVGHIAWRAGK